MLSYVSYIPDLRPNQLKLFNSNPKSYNIINLLTQKDT